MLATNLPLEKPCLIAATVDAAQSDAIPDIPKSKLSRNKQATLLADNDAKLNSPSRGTSPQSPRHQEINDTSLHAALICPIKHDIVGPSDDAQRSKLLSTNADPVVSYKKNELHDLPASSSSFHRRFRFGEKRGSTTASSTVVAVDVANDLFAPAIAVLHYVGKLKVKEMEIAPAKNDDKINDWPGSFEKKNSATTTPSTTTYCLVLVYTYMEFIIMVALELVATAAACLCWMFMSEYLIKLAGMLIQLVVVCFLKVSQ